MVILDDKDIEGLSKAKLEEKGYDTVLDVFLVGSLRTWDRENDPLLGKLGIGRN